MAAMTVTTTQATALLAEGASFSMKLDTLKIPMILHRKNRQRLCERMSDVPEGSVIVVEGAKTQYRDATDHEPLVRQESYFQWLFGVKEPDCFGVVFPNTGRSALFVPRLPEEYAIWMGPIKTLADYKAAYEVDDVFYVDELDGKISVDAISGNVYLLQGKNTDSGLSCAPASLTNLPAFSSRGSVNYERLHLEMTSLRLVKTEEELEVMRYVGRVSSSAHVKVMQSAKAGMAEYQLESLFRHLTYAEGGCRFQAYTCICGGGVNSAVLHYGHAGAANDCILEDGKLNLFDMGGEYHCYAADITCTFPTSGTFTPEQKDLYEAVLAARAAALGAARPGIQWEEVHKLAERAMLATLVERGFLKGCVDDMMEVRLGAVLQPHGLGHLIGLDTHDVGGYSFGRERSTEPGLRSLRLQGPLMEGMCVTVEPGLYVIKPLIEAALKDEAHQKFFVPGKFDRLLLEGFGGIRLEDDIIITASGHENTTFVPREVADVEAVMAGAAWPPAE